uniref:hypothetical protein n=1 Tax=Paenibacillus sp. HB172176 TaxID=2493690 RepID=UPI00143A8409
MKKWFVMLFILLIGIIGIQHNANAEDATQIIDVNYSSDGHSKLNESDQFEYSDQSSREATFNIPAKTGFIIKNVRWEYLDGELARNAAGDWTGKKSFVGTDTITGTPILVGTTRSKSYGGIFYWNRSGGSNIWKATMSNGVQVTSSGCSSAPKDSFDLRAYPNCNSLSFGEDALSLVLKKDGGYYIDSIDGGIQVDDEVVDINTIKPGVIEADYKTPIDSEIYDRSGYADHSTTYINKYDVLSKTSIRAYFSQDHDCVLDPVTKEPNCQYENFANPGARQMWWYSAMKFTLQATTYRYLDKHLVVEWMPEENEITEIKVRHMVRLGSTGTYAQAAQTSTTLADPLPLSRTITADASYGTVKGRNVNYSSFSNSILNGTQVTVNLSSTQKTAYVTFFYEKPEPQFTGDFDIVPSVIEYRDSFSFVPKDFVMNGCAYQS